MNIDDNLKAIAETFLQMVAKGEVEAAFNQYVSPNFRHHNPYFKGDARSLMKAMTENAIGFPRKTLDIKHNMQEGDLIAVHSKIKLEPDNPETAVVHIFRFEDGKIVELWDIGQAMPINSPNQHGMF